MTPLDFWRLGREQRLARRNPAVRLFMWLFGPIGLHSRIRAGHVLKHIRRLPLPARARVLDAGAGHGLVLFALAREQPSYVLEGLELEPELVAACEHIARRLGPPAPTFRQADLAALQSLDGPYDLIFSIDVLEHIHADVQVLRLLRGGLAPDGWLLLHLPLRHQQQWRFFSAFKAHTVADHVRDEYTPDEISARLAEAGFEVCYVRHGFGRAGEMAFELNTLFWRQPALRAALALLTYPLAWWLAWADTAADPPTGNSLIVLARPAAGAQGG